MTHSMTRFYAHGSGGLVPCDVQSVTPCHGPLGRRLDRTMAVVQKGDFLRPCAASEGRPYLVAQRSRKSPPTPRSPWRFGALKRFQRCSL